MRGHDWAEGEAPQDSSREASDDPPEGPPEHGCPSELSYSEAGGWASRPQQPAFSHKLTRGRGVLLGEVVLFGSGQFLGRS